ncbi:CLUMA_CG000404, isoform A [Clunio marinus]|uniref:CLUMA_CG000404, isoform A n=1 Tax=Clunio marinus TaxID=568069 RepID=A0A1J1HJF8_9DIPT|nr:CLUMA_CG000404, isoform A [Clunio marinus]
MREELSNTFPLFINKITPGGMDMILLQQFDDLIEHSPRVILKDCDYIYASKTNEIYAVFISSHPTLSLS